jgi:hypothetical protein
MYPSIWLLLFSMIFGQGIPFPGLGMPVNASGWHFVQRQWATGSANPFVTPAFSSPLTPGSTLIYQVYWQYATPVTPTDTTGNSYTDCGAGVIGGLDMKIQLFYRLNSSSTASNVVSVANPSNYDLIASVSEFTGGTTSSPVDVYTSQPGGNTGTVGGQNMRVGPITPAVSGELIIGIQYAGTGTTSAGTGFTNIGYYGMQEYLIQGSTTPIAATWHDSLNGDAYSAIVAAFKHL